MPRKGQPREPGRWRPQHGHASYRRLRRRILDERGWRCEDCGRAGRLELHHVIAVEDGGDDSPDNLKVLCRPCHCAAASRRTTAAPARTAASGARRSRAALPNHSKRRRTTADQSNAVALSVAYRSGIESVS